MHATAAINRLIVPSHAFRKLRRRVARYTHVRKENDED